MHFKTVPSFLFPSTITSKPFIAIQPLVETHKNRFLCQDCTRSKLHAIAIMGVMIPQLIIHNKKK